MKIGVKILIGIFSLYAIICIALLGYANYSTEVYEFSTYINSPNVFANFYEENSGYLQGLFSISQSKKSQVCKPKEIFYSNDEIEKF